MLVDYLKYLITPLLQHPNQLDIQQNGQLISIQVNPEDVGRVIGKKGVVVHHLRVLAKTFATTHKLPVATLVINAANSSSPASA